MKGSLRKILIRRGTTTDAALLTDLGARTFVETFAADNSEENMSAYLTSAFTVEQQSAELSDPLRTVFIAEMEGVAVGYAMLMSGEAPQEINAEKPIELVRLYVSKDCLGNGVGASLMQRCLDEAAAQEYKTVWLGVWENNHRAVAFYSKWGFEKIGTHPFVIGDLVETDWVMRRTVNNEL